MLPKRIAEKFERRGEDECWPWTGAISGGGYGYIWWKGKTRRAHRVVYELLVGPIPDDRDLDHVKARGCTLRHCVNPGHLEPVTHAENVRRGDGGKVNNRNAEKTHCPKGHPLEWAPSLGRRVCRPCRAGASRRHRERVMA